MAFDPNLNETVLFGGFDDQCGGGCPYGDTWTYSDGTWSNDTANLTISPTANYGGCLAYDPQLAGVIQFGGHNQILGVDFNQTWLFNATGWHNLTSGTAPSARWCNGLAWDPTDQYMLLFGGSLMNHTNLNDSWALNGTTWTQISPKYGIAPPAAGFGEITWDATDGYMVAFGGDASFSSIIGNVCGLASYTWTYVGGQWTNRTVPGASAPPFPGGTTTLLYDPSAFAVVLFGGGYLSSLHVFSV
jgi:hypothetical protein